MLGEGEAEDGDSGGEFHGCWLRVVGSLVRWLLLGWY